MYYYGWSSMMHGVGAFWGGLLMVVFWVLVIWAIIALIRGPHHWHRWHNQAGADGVAPLDILKARYAKGEIDKKEFDEKKKDLLAD